MVTPIENPHPLADDPIEMQTFGPLDPPAPAPSATPLTDAFDQALADITDRRGAVYGHPAVDFTRAAAIKAVVAECKDPLIRHVLEMIAVKMCRLIETPSHLDSLIDIAGYARTGVMCLDRQQP